jgi:hypothetical protein
MEVSHGGEDAGGVLHSRELRQLPSITREATCELSQGGKPLSISGVCNSSPTRRFSRAFPVASTKSGVALEIPITPVWSRLRTQEAASSESVDIGMGG